MIALEAFMHPVAQATKEVYIEFLRLDPTKHTEFWRDQVSRAVLSIGANWCEAWGRRPQEYVSQFLRFARGSAYEAVWFFEVDNEIALSNKCKAIANALDKVIPDTEGKLKELPDPLILIPNVFNFQNKNPKY